MVPTALAVLYLSLAAPADLPAKKLIHLGWDQPNTARLREHLAVIESRPFDGVMVSVEGRTPDGKTVPLKRLLTAEAWDESWFEEAMADLAACDFQRLTHNFVLVGANPGDVDWFDEAGWASVTAHWRLAARIAARAKFAGIAFDPEPYTRPHALFRYDGQPGKDAHTFAEYAAMARRRGAEMMRAVVEEYPDLTLLTLFMNSINRTAARSAQPEQALASSGYGLYPAFIDGWLEVAPPGVTFVDGCESAYLYNSVEQYLDAAVAIKGLCQRLVAPENRAKYRAQVQVGYGIYLDAYWNPKDSEYGRWYVDGLGGERVDRLRANTAAALRAADEYVWIYGEKFRWWPTPNGRVWEQTWDEGLPGTSRALGLARSPADYARARLAELREAGQLTNLARNGDFSSATAPGNDGAMIDWVEGRAPAGWSAWQYEWSKGALVWDQERGAARASRVGSGCFIQTYPARPGEVYAVRVSQRVQGRGRTWLRLRWQTEDSKWIAEPLDVIAYVEEGALDEWAPIFAAGEVPDGAGKLVLLLGVEGQEGDEDIAWFDDVEVYRVD